jgi:hypothetical protein
MLLEGRVARGTRLRIHRTIAQPADFEFVQVTVGPTHRPLEHAMQLRQLQVLRNENPTPDRRLDATQGDPQLQHQRLVGLQTSDHRRSSRIPFRFGHSCPDRHRG